MGLQIHHKNNNHIKTLVRRPAVLPWVPIEHVQDIWLNPLEDINLADTNINTESFTDYVTEYWIESHQQSGTTSTPMDPEQQIIWKVGITN